MQAPKECLKKNPYSSKCIVPESFHTPSTEVDNPIVYCDNQLSKLQRKVARLKCSNCVIDSHGQWLHLQCQPVGFALLATKRTKLLQGKTRKVAMATGLRPKRDQSSVVLCSN